MRTRLLTALVWICGAMYFAWINSQLEVDYLEGGERSVTDSSSGYVLDSQRVGDAR